MSLVSAAALDPPRPHLGTRSVTFDQPLLFGTLVRRYKRFLADVDLEGGERVTAHCPNSGSMRMCSEPGWRVGLSRSPNPNRKLAYTWEIVHNGDCWIGVNTQVPNRVVEEALRQQTLARFAEHRVVGREVRYGRENSRVDLVAEHGARTCFIEVKNVTLVGDDGAYCFPDAVTSRGLKHLRELSAVVRDGHEAVMLYVIQRSDGHGFRAANEIDPAYAEGLDRARAAGVEARAYRASVTPHGIDLLDHEEPFPD
jgi:sugar fermentation stimulation protein A